MGLVQTALLRFYIRIFDRTGLGEILWNGESQGNCIDSVGLAWSNAIIGVVMDILINDPDPPPSLVEEASRYADVLCRYSAPSPSQHNQYDLAFWTFIEVSVSILCCCMTAICRILAKALPTLCPKLDRYHSSDRCTDPSRRENQDPAPNLSLRVVVLDSLTTRLQLVLQDTEDITATQ
ncbi:hypothetical protein CSUB01_00798 [Colletotrichum sublineola]|uniref:Uncharacterized protein n=1 Tax=Colletotrichum sublineola TaxID=1173701 RepID=A0A066WWQ1_COLSU|nr:hypothetical protein CSUB01_00798 [Colletotrichum sublineola]